MAATVARISVTPVKGLALQHPDSVELTHDGVPGDRAFFLVDEHNVKVSATRLGALVSAGAEYDAQHRILAITLPDGRVVRGQIVLGRAEPVRFSRLELEAQPVAGGFSEALSELVGRPLRLMRAPARRPAVDRGAAGGATLISRASLERLAQQLGVGDLDARRFRMTFEIAGLEAHAEDGWIGRDVQVGTATIRVGGNVGRCALTTRNPDTGVVDLKTLHALAGYRADVPTTEALPLGVHGAVVAPGHVRVGDAVALYDA